jgi:hypothetical protein
MHSASQRIVSDGHHKAHVIYEVGDDQCVAGVARRDRDHCRRKLIAQSIDDQQQSLLTALLGSAYREGTALPSLRAPIRCAS